MLERKMVWHSDWVESLVPSPPQSWCAGGHARNGLSWLENSWTHQDKGAALGTRCSTSVSVLDPFPILVKGHLRKTGLAAVMRIPGSAKMMSRECQRDGICMWRGSGHHKPNVCMWEVAAPSSISFPSYLYYFTDTVLRFLDDGKTIRV